MFENIGGNSMRQKLLDMNIVLLIISILAGIFIILKQFVLYNVPEWFEWGSEFGELLYDTSLGYLVTYWFFYLTVYRPEQEHKKRANAYVQVFAKKIALAYDSLKEDVVAQHSEALKLSEVEKGSKNEINIILTRTKPGNISPRMNNLFQPMTWADLFLTQRNQIERFLREITLVYNQLEPHQNEIITKMLSHDYLELIRNIPLEQLEDLQFLTQGMWEFGHLIEELKDEFINS